MLRRPARVAKQSKADGGVNQEREPARDQANVRVRGRERTSRAWALTHADFGQEQEPWNEPWKRIWHMARSERTSGQSWSLAANDKGVGAWADLNPA